jgi:GT2 family glycosyltransferase
MRSELGVPPEVSLMMPVWNPRGEWLREAVESALGQRGCSLELIVVDDGCPVPVSTLLADLDDPRMRIIRCAHGGEAAARNVGIAAARGRYLRFVDADDVLEPGSTARLLRLAAGADDVIAYGSTISCDAELRPDRDNVISSRIEGDATAACLLNRFTCMVPAMLFPAGVVAAAGPWDPGFRACGDWDWCLRALEHARVRGEPAPALFYRRHATSASTDRPAAWAGCVRTVEGYFERHPEARGTALQRRAEAMLLVLAARQHTRGRPWLDRRFWRGVAHAPLWAAGMLPLYLARKARRGVLRRARRLAPPALRGWLRSLRAPLAAPPPLTGGRSIHV